MYESHGSEQPLEGQVADTLLYPQGSVRRKRNEPVQAVGGVWLQGPCEWTSCIMSFIILWMDGSFLSLI